VVIGGTPVANDKPIMAALRASSEHTRFVAGLEASGLDTVLAGIPPITVSAPTDAAFVKADIRSDLGILKQTLLGHIVPARLTTEDLSSDFRQLNGKTKIFALNKQVIIATGEAESPQLIDMQERMVDVVRADALAGNGILHVVNGVLLPENEEALVTP